METRYYWLGLMDAITGGRYGPRPRTQEQRDAYTQGLNAGLAIKRAERKERTGSQNVETP